MISDEKLQAKAKELLDELDFQGYTRGEIAYLGTCFQSYAIHGELTKIKEREGIMINPALEIHIDGLSLYAIYGNACLGLRHPGNQGGSRLVAISAIQSIGAYLVDSGVITDNIRFEHEKELTRWAKDYQEAVLQWEYESTNWYMEQPEGGLKSVGKEEPDYSKYHPPEPKHAYSLKFQEYEGHVLLEEKDYIANQALFRHCLAFKLEECMNYVHPLYKDPNKAIKTGRKSKGRITAKSFAGDQTLSSPNSVTLPDELEDSVRKCGVSSEISSGEIGQKKERVSRNYDIPDGCLKNGDCDNCEHNDECPVIGEEEI